MFTHTLTTRAPTKAAAERVIEPAPANLSIQDQAADAVSRKLEELIIPRPSTS